MKQPIIKFVKKAGHWCKTWFDEKGNQHQDWSLEKPDKK